MIFIWYLLTAAPLLQFASAYNYICNTNETCNINCTGIVNTSNPIPTPTTCNDLTIDASSASSLIVSCANNSYCDSMTIYAPYEPLLTSSNLINCIGGDNVCNNIQIYTNNTKNLYTYCGNNKNGPACSNAKIYGLSGPGLTYFQCHENTQCNSITIHNYDTTSIQISNQGIMNELNMTAPYAHTIRFDEGSIGHIYNNCYVDNRHANIQSGINTASWINSEFYLSGLDYNNWNGGDFYNNKIHFLFGLQATLLFSGSVNIHNNIFYVENNPIDIRVEEKVRFMSNQMFANYTSHLHVYMAGINASISNNTIYAQHAKNIEFQIEDKRDSINNNNFHFENAANVTLTIWGKLFENKIFGQYINRFILLCLYDGAVCASDKYFLSNANYVLIQAGGGSNGVGGVMNGGYFDVMNVSNLKIFSYFGFMRNMNINAIYAHKINVTMYSGQLYNSVINASMSNSLNVWCKSFNYWHDMMNHTDCNGLTLRVSAPLNGVNRASLLCDGMGCQNLDLYTINGAKDINITGENCNCHSLDSYSHAQCVDEWNIYCNGGSEASVLSSIDKCDGVCCDDVIDRLDFDDLSHCSKHDSNLRGLWIALIVICILILVVVGAWLAWTCYKKQNLKTQPLLVQDDIA